MDKERTQELEQTGCGCGCTAQDEAARQHAADADGCCHDHDGDCGHDHDHDDGDACCCGHDHDDSDDCCCGHDHDDGGDCCCGHDHDDGDACCCGHDHDDGDTCCCGHDHDGDEDHHRHHHGKKHRHHGCGCCGDDDDDCCDDDDDGCGCGHDHDHGADTDEVKELAIRLNIGAVLLFAAILLRALLPTAVSVALYAAAYLVIAWSVLCETWEHLRRGRIFDENLLMTVASLGAFILGDHLEAIAVVALYQVGELLQGLAVAKSKKSIAAMMDIRPDHADVLAADGTTTRTQPAEVPVDSRILVRPGERVPLDGVIEEGSSALDTAALTGESLPREVAVGDEILSGSINLQGALTVRTTRPFADSTVQRILRLTQESAAKKSATERFITRFARIYTPVVFGLAAALAVVPGLIGLLAGGSLSWDASFGTWIYRALTFLVVSCPCALVISVPVGFLAGMGGAARRGVVLKGGVVLDALCNADTVVFDKTGTLTEGRFTVTQAVCAPGVSQQQLMAAAALCEADSTHPIAQSVMRWCQDQVSVAVRSDYQELAGMGVLAVADGLGSCLAGNRRLMQSYDIELPQSETEAEDGRTMLYVAANGAFLGTLYLEDAPKAGVNEALTALRAAGIRRMALLSGDRTAAVQSLADRLGLDYWCAEMLPQDKVEAFAALEDGAGSRIYVGDGINDAPLLAAADIGFAMGGVGSDAAVEAADAVLMKDDVGGVALALRCARRTRGIVRQNIVFALFVKLLVLVLAAVGFAPMWLAIFADVGVALLCVANATRAMALRA